MLDTSRRGYTATTKSQIRKLIHNGGFVYICSSMLPNPNLDHGGLNSALFYSAGMQLDIHWNFRNITRSSHFQHENVATIQLVLPLKKLEAYQDENSEKWQSSVRKK